MDKKLFDSEEINDWHKKLNSKECLPQRGYRRNAGGYALICYVNNIMGCYLSCNEGPIPVFIGRARQHMTDYQDNEEWHEYYEMVKKYLHTVETYFAKHGVDMVSLYNSRDKSSV